jgi:hypothetical protein
MTGALLSTPSLEQLTGGPGIALAVLAVAVLVARDAVRVARPSCGGVVRALTVAGSVFALMVVCLAVVRIAALAV